MSTTTTIPTTWLSKQRKTHIELLHSTEVPRRFQQARLSDVQPSGLVKVAQRYSDEFWNVAPNGIAPLFLGTAGQYKTMTAAAIANGIRTHYLLDVAWCNCATEFVQFDREAFDPSTKKRLDWLKSAPFLVMDDFTSVPPKSRMAHTLVELGCTRYDAMLPTLWTGNLLITKTDRTPLVAAVGAALSRRILEASEGFAVQVKA